MSLGSPTIEQQTLDKREDEPSVTSTENVDGCQLHRSNCALPQVIIDLLFEHFEDHIIPFDIPAGVFYGNVHALRRGTGLLRTLSLVHRTWTTPAQKILRRRLIKSDETSIRFFLQSRFLGPWVHEVALHIDDRHESLDLVHYADLFRRLPGIRAMALYLNLCKQDTILRQLLLFTRLHLRTIKALWIFDCSSRSTRVTNPRRYNGLFKDIALLSDLELLSISLDTREAEDSKFPLSVKVLELDGSDTVIGRSLKILTRTKVDVAIRELSLSIFRDQDLFRPSFGRTAFDQLQNLYIRIGREEMYKGVSAVLSNCRDLRSLDLFPQNIDEALTRLRSSIPPGLRRLAIHYSPIWFATATNYPAIPMRSILSQQNAARNSGRDVALSELIQSLPKLESLFLTALGFVRDYANKRRIRSLAREMYMYGVEVTVPLHFIRTKQVCEERGILFLCKMFEPVVESSNTVTGG